MGILGLLLLLFLLFLSYYFIFVCQKCRVYASSKSQLEFLDKLQTLKEIYYPAFFYFHGILQSSFGLTKRLPTTRLPYTRELFTLKDGGEIALDYLEPNSISFPTSTSTSTPVDCSNQNGKENQDGFSETKLKSKKKILTIILPGMTSASQTSYVKTLAIASATAGSHVVVINNRGLGGVPLKTPRLFCATNCEDAEEIFRYLYGKFPDYHRIAIGTSLGGIVLCHYLNKNQEEAKKVLSCALVISVVWDAPAGMAGIEKPIPRYLVNHGLAHSLKTLVKKHRTALEPDWDVDYILENSPTLRKFDENFTAPHFKYKSSEEYYETIRLSNKLMEFPIPVYGLNAADDPINLLPDLPLNEAQKKGSKLALIVTNRGGHLGFLEGFWPTSKRMHFMERFVHEFLVVMSRELECVT